MGWGAVWNTDKHTRPAPGPSLAHRGLPGRVAQAHQGVASPLLPARLQLPLHNYVCGIFLSAQLWGRWCVGLWEHCPHLGLGQRGACWQPPSPGPGGEGGHGWRGKGWALGRPDPGEGPAAGEPDGDTHTRRQGSGRALTLLGRAYSRQALGAWPVLSRACRGRVASARRDMDGHPLTQRYTHMCHTCARGTWQVTSVRVLDSGACGWEQA